MAKDIQTHEDDLLGQFRFLFLCVAGIVVWLFYVNGYLWVLYLPFMWPVVFLVAFYGAWGILKVKEWIG